MSSESLNHSKLLKNDDFLPGSSESKSTILDTIAIEEKAFRDAINADIPFAHVKQIRERINRLTAQLKSL